MIPVAVENSAHVTRAATAIDAGNLCDASLIAKNNFATIPARSTKYPINKNKGTAVRTVLSIYVYVFDSSKENIRISSKCSILDGSK